MKFLNPIIKLLTNSLFLGTGLSLIFAYLTLHTLGQIINWSDVLGEKPKSILAAETLHLKSIDYRLWARGERKGDSNVALLAVDDDSIRRVGRWPWPREKIAKVIDEVVKHGAKVISFDITFSEPSLHPTKMLYETHNLNNVLPENVNTIILDKISSLDSDTILANMFQRHSEKVVIGGFNEELQFSSFDDVENVCYSIYYPITSTANYWETQILPLIPLDPDSSLIDKGVLHEQVIDQYRQHFSEIYLGKLKELAKEQQLTITDFFSQRKIERIINDHFIREVCPNWLVKGKDPFYPTMSQLWASEVVPNDEEGNFEASFDEWVQNFRNSVLSYEIRDKSDWTLTTQTAIYGSNYYSKNIFELNTMTPLQITDEAEEDPPLYHFGFFNAELDDDGTIRRKALVTRSGNSFYPSIALKAFLVANNYNAQITQNLLPEIYGNRRVITSLKILDEEAEPIFSVPVNRKGEMMINYAGERWMFAYANVADIIEDSKPTVRVSERVLIDGKWQKVENDFIKSDWIKDKIFVIGATALAVFDLRVTPFDENFPGAETHLNVIDNLIRQDFLRPLDKADLIMAFLVLVLGIFLSVVLTYTGALIGFTVSGLTIAFIVLGDKIFYFDKGIITPIIFPLLSSGSLYIVLTFYKYFTEEKKKKELKGTFSKYVSPSIVDEVLKDPENLELGGRKQMMSVFFSDIRGFTTISEQLDPQELSDLLNSYLTPMTELVFQNKGTLDKYMGDAVMAFFGAPISYPDHAEAACRCAIQSLEKLTDLQAEYREKGLPMIDIGIGINTGDMSVGNMGSETVRSYTVMGDAVNLGARLEGINKQYGTRIIISEYTHNHVKDQFLCREIDWVRVKGKVEPVRIFECIADGKGPETINKIVDLFNSGFQLYHEMEFQQAQLMFSKALDIDPEDGPSKLYNERCQDYIDNPPPSDWDGVFVMTTK